MSSKRPNIAVTGPDKGGRVAWWFTRLALFIGGGRAIWVRPKEGVPDAEIHGLIIGGGADINPERYGQTDLDDLFTKHGKVTGIRQFFSRLATILFFPLIYLARKLFSTKSARIDNQRDELEFSLLEQALEKGIPVLGICRGAQLINIHLGGTLYSDITNYYTEVPQVMSVWPKKMVQIKRESKLYQLLGYQQVWVNGLHHQAIDTVGSELQIVAHEKNGIVQAIEHDAYPFLLGVQWHPEYMPQIPPQRRIFEALVDEAQEFVDGE